MAKNIITQEKIIKLVGENPDLTYEFIKNILVAQQEIIDGKLEVYKDGFQVEPGMTLREPKNL